MENTGVDTTKTIEMIDKVIFYLFQAGVFKDQVIQKENGRDDEKIQGDFYTPFGMMLFGLIVERLFINWLTNRFGCNFNKFQKCAEFDIRRKALKNNWDVCPPSYNVNNYRNFYYREDFDELAEKFTENEFTREVNRKKFYKMQEIRDFIPSKIALRVKKMIEFSVKLEGRAPDLKLDKESIRILDILEQEKKKKPMFLRTAINDSFVSETFVRRDTMDYSINN
jgi:hypothetical protein